MGEGEGAREHSVLPFVVAARIKLHFSLQQLYELTVGEREKEREREPLRHFVDQKLNLFAAIKSHFRGRCHKFCQFLRLRFTVASYLNCSCCCCFAVLAPGV